jgi:hypothetical protein
MTSENNIVCTVFRSSKKKVKRIGNWIFEKIHYLTLFAARIRNAVVLVRLRLLRLGSHEVARAEVHSVISHVWIAKLFTRTTNGI